MQRVHKQGGARTYPQLLNMPGLETEAESRSSENHATVLSSELCCFLVARVERAPRTLAGLIFLIKSMVHTSKDKIKSQ